MACLKHEYFKKLSTEYHKITTFAENMCPIKYAKLQCYTLITFKKKKIKLGTFFSGPPGIYIYIGVIYSQQSSDE